MKTKCVDYFNRFGRKPLLGFGIALLLISTAVRPLIPSLDVVTIFEFFNGFGSVIYYIVPYVLGKLS